MPAAAPAAEIVVPRREPGSPPSGFLDLVGIETARQLALVDSRLFNAIRPQECLRKAWMSPRLKHTAPNVLACIAHFNGVAAWVSWEVTYESSLRERARVLLRFLEIAVECFRLKAYCTTQEIMAALDAAPVRRLEHTWREARGLARREVLAKWDEIQAALSFEQNCKAPLALLARCEPPCVPYLGMYLTQIAKLEEGTPDTLPAPASAQRAVAAATAAAAAATPCASIGGTPPVLINFAKRRKIAQIIARIQVLQGGSYTFCAFPPVERYLKQRMGSWEAALFDASIRSDRDATCAKALEDAAQAASLLIEPRNSPRGALLGSTPAGGLGGSMNALLTPRRGSVMPGDEMTSPRSPRGSPADPPKPSPRRRSVM